MSVDVYNNIFCAGTNAVLTAPDAQSAADVVVGGAPLVRTESTFVDVFGNPRDGPHLTMMGVAAELEVDLMTLGLIKMIGLMIERSADFISTPNESRWMLLRSSRPMMQRSPTVTQESCNRQMPAS